MKVYDKIVARRAEGKTAMLSCDEVSQLFEIRTLFTRIHLDLINICRTHPDLANYDILEAFDSLCARLNVNPRGRESFEDFKARLDRQSSELARNICTAAGIRNSDSIDL